MEKDAYNCRIDGIVTSGGMIHVKDEFLPPKPVMKILVFLSQYYPKITMPATDFESTFDEAFGDKEWARTARQNPKIVVAIQPTLGSIAATLGTGDKLMARAKELSGPLFAVHERMIVALIVPTCRSLSTKSDRRKRVLRSSRRTAINCFKISPTWPKMWLRV